MYDPHRLRRNDRRFFTRKGQIIQAKNMSAPFTIESNKVEAYKQYIIKNHLIQSQIPINIDSIKINSNDDDTNILLSQFLYSGSESLQVNLGSGIHICILLTENPSYFNFHNFINTGTIMEVPSNTWYAYTDITNTGCKIYFQNNGIDLFNTELVGYNNYITTSDIEIIKTMFSIKLPDPSE